MNHTIEIALKKSATETINWFVSTLSSQGYSVIHKDEISCTLAGPGQTNTRQNPLLGATELNINCNNNLLTVKAYLGGVKWLRNFLIIFPIGLTILLALIFALTSILNSKVIYILLGTLAPWPIITPLFSNFNKKRTVRSLEVLVRNSQY